MKKTKHFLGILINKHLQGNISPKEKKLLQGFMKKMYDKSEWQGDLMGNSDSVSFKIKKKLDNSINKKTIRIQTWIKYSAAASIALVLSLSIYVYSDVRAEETILTAVSQSNIDSLRLSDGSLIIMSPYSKIKYPKKFKNGRRDIELIKGNSFFEVTRNPESPFIVKSGDLITKVLGTSFNIFLTDSIIEVSVATGKVNVSTHNNEVELIPMERAVFSALNNKLSKQIIKNKKIYCWHCENLELENVALGDIAIILELRFGTKFNFQNPQLTSKVLTINISNKDTIDDIVEQINFITDFKLKRIANEIQVK